MWYTWVTTCIHQSFLIKSHPLTPGLSLGASEVPFPSEESSSIWSEPRCGESKINRVTHNINCFWESYSRCGGLCKTSSTCKQAAGYVLSGVERVPTSWRCNRARSQRAWRRRGARSNTWWWTSCCCDPLGPTQGRGEGTAWSQSAAKQKATSGIIKHRQKLCVFVSHVQIYLPEPAALQDGEGAAQQLQEDVASVEDLQEGNKSATKDGIEKELMDMDVQHTPAMEVVEEEKSCRNRQTAINGKSDEKSGAK